MSIALVVTRGFSNGTLTGSISDVVTRGFTIGEAVESSFGEYIVMTPVLNERRISPALKSREIKMQR